MLITLTVLLGEGENAERLVELVFLWDGRTNSQPGRAFYSIKTQRVALPHIPDNVLCALSGMRGRTDARRTAGRLPPGPQVGGAPRGTPSPPEAYHRPALHRKHRQSTYLDETKPLVASDLVKSSRIDEYIIGRIPRKWGRGGRYKQRNQVKAALNV